MLLKLGKWEREKVLSEVPLLLCFLQTLPLLLLWRNGFSEGFRAGERLPSRVETYTGKSWQLWLLSVPQFVGIKVQNELRKRVYLPVLWPECLQCPLQDSPHYCRSGRHVDGLPSDRSVVVTWRLPLQSQAQRAMDTSVPLHMPICVAARRSPVPFLQRSKWRGDV